MPPVFYLLINIGYLRVFFMTHVNFGIIFFYMNSFSIWINIELNLWVTLVV